MEKVDTIRQDQNRIFQVSGRISQLKCLHQEEQSWWHNWHIFSNYHKFEVTHFVAQIHQYPVCGAFTQLVFSEGDEVEVILKASPHAESFEVFALKQGQILHIQPALHHGFLHLIQSNLFQCGCG